MPSEVENAPGWVHFLSWVTQGFLRASTGSRERSAPSFFARDRHERAKARTVEGKSEKLAQERPCGNRDRFVVGKRIGSGVWKVSHDLKGVRGSRRFLHQYQTDRWVRMVNTKLTDRSEWCNRINNPAEDRALSFFPRQQSGWHKEGKTCGR